LAALFQQPRILSVQPFSGECRMLEQAAAR
jgi:hypothetical protein